MEIVDWNKKKKQTTNENWNEEKKKLKHNHIMIHLISVCPYR